ncbi:hypothetical protein EMIHUDRAFT_233046 [Emiliania huxleyi CCMP1516]|uniref:Uncharacterized protein n=2 Tax=Emiliania huxleyi TaxID=2903 RepID=A0A0D3K3L9_EMIH1|nr:hypothetical protein EMIHUDRAFT_233046 [Emiliania huxleyi CCMP1516]EOD30354.1 hypothetical protein EMIHUDRAFT_233046 [Emiliania huxleyi CCMP1516]|eukprot:XP_005782783.1 hypothetical protein EMIHUDRAFT_233046 [Emiliania huxleyi CCMP1516]
MAGSSTEILESNSSPDPAIFGDALLRDMAKLWIRTLDGRSGQRRRPSPALLAAARQWQTEDWRLLCRDAADAADERGADPPLITLLLSDDDLAYARHRQPSLFFELAPPRDSLCSLVDVSRMSRASSSALDTSSLGLSTLDEDARTPSASGAPSALSPTPLLGAADLENDESLVTAFSALLQRALSQAVRQPKVVQGGIEAAFRKRQNLRLRDARDRVIELLRRANLEPLGSSDALVALFRDVSGELAALGLALGASEAWADRLYIEDRRGALPARASSTAPRALLFSEEELDEAEAAQSRLEAMYNVDAWSSQLKGTMTSEERVKRALKRLEEDVPYHVALFAEPVSLRTLPNELRQLGERLLGHRAALALEASGAEVAEARAEFESVDASLEPHIPARGVGGAEISLPRDGGHESHSVEAGGCNVFRQAIVANGSEGEGAGGEENDVRK